MHKNGHHHTTGPVPPQQTLHNTQSDTRRPSEERARTNAVENLLQSQTVETDDAGGRSLKDQLHSDSPLYINEPQPPQPPMAQQQQPQQMLGQTTSQSYSRPSGQSVRSDSLHAPPSQFAHRQQSFVAGDGPEAQQQGPRRSRQHAATISEPMGPQAALQRGTRSILSPPQNSFRLYQQPQHQQQQPPPQGPRTPGYDGRGRRLSFVGPPLAADAQREHYETSFSRSTSSANYVGSAQPSPQAPYFGGSPYATRPAYAQPMGIPHAHTLPHPPPSSAPAHQQHFGAYGLRQTHSSLPTTVGQRSLSPGPPRRHLPVPGRFDTGSGGGGPLPFPRISSPSMQQQQQQQQPPPPQQQQQEATTSATSQSPARESTRRLSSVVWGPTGFERLESGMSRCRICGKEYSKGSSTGTLKRHFRQHQVNVGPANPYSRPSPPATSTAPHHTARPRAYSHRTETRTRRDASPFAAPRSRAPPAATATAAAAPLTAPLMVPKNEPGRRVPPSSRSETMGDIDQSSAIAGSALLSMAAGDSHGAVGQDIPARRPARASDPSIYPQSINAAAPAVDPDTRDISVSPSPSTSSGDAMEIDGEHQHKRRRATIVGVQRVLAAPQLEREIDALSATQLVALSSELVRRVAGALPMLAAEAEHSAADIGGVRGSGGRADPLDLLFRHVKHAMLERQSSATAAINGTASKLSSSFPLDFPPPPPSDESLPFTIRKQVPLPLLNSRHIADTVQALSLSEMSLLSRVSAAMQRIAPLSLAAREWDNVGILLEAAKPRAEASRVFMTIDLTPQTLGEALEDPSVGVIVSYHPPIFAAWKSLTMSNLKQSLVLKCAAAGVSIYSPHTSLDSCANGINDWLAGLISEKDSAIVAPITPASVEDAMGQENVGSGRVIELPTPQPLDAIVTAVKQKLGLDRIRVARAVCHSGEKQKMVSKVAICAGSGASVVGHVDADVYFTGEMGHHDMLGAIAKGTSCILAEHSNSERGYLKAVLAKRLQQQLDADNVDTPTTIVVSEQDCDPVTIE
ncbi:hypothetical protein H4R24_003813 [Coemansia sp. RSA 988]|nr:hypothetical protein H4R24_003813 [Coemansia sp. RSA 988]